MKLSTKLREESYHALIAFRLVCRRQHVSVSYGDVLVVEAVRDVALLKFHGCFVEIHTALRNIDILLSGLTTKDTPCETHDLS